MGDHQVTMGVKSLSHGTPAIGSRVKVKTNPKLQEFSELHMASEMVSNPDSTTYLYIYIYNQTKI